MFRSTTTHAFALAVLPLAAGPALASTVYFDGVFAPNNWTLTTINDAAASGSTVVAAQVLAGGNAGEFRRVEHNAVVASAGAAMVGVHMKPSAVYDPTTQGAITSIDYSEDSINFVPLTGNGQGAGLAIQQSGKTYIQRSPILVMPYEGGFSSWTSNAAPGLVAADLWELLPTGAMVSSSNPDFSAAGAPMQLGFWRGNSSGNSDLDYYRDAGIDNWRVEIVPAPATLALLGAAGLVTCRRRR